MPHASGPRRQGAARGRRIVLTGTPVENRLSDLWSLFDFLNPGLLGSAKAFTNFVKQMEARAEPSYQPLRTLVQPYLLRRLKTDKRVIADLPDKTEVKAYCGLTRQQAALYEQAVRDLKEKLEDADGIQRRGLVLAYLMRFKQICNHPARCSAMAIMTASTAASSSAWPSCARSWPRGRKRRSFSPSSARSPSPWPGSWRRVWPARIDAARRHRGRQAARAGGELPARKRAAFLRALAQGRGTGLNLTAASQVIHFDRWWNPAVEDQATDRAFRIGQKRNVLYTNSSAAGRSRSGSTP